MVAKRTESASKKHVWGDRFYKIADSTWTVAGWLWSAVIIVFLVSYAAALASASDSTNNFNTIVLNWLGHHQVNPTQEAYRLIVISLLIVFISITLLSVLLRQLLKPSSVAELQDVLDLMKKDVEATLTQAETQKEAEEKAFRFYLHALSEKCQYLSPRGLAQHSRTLVLTSVPLEETLFTGIRLIPDRPVYDAPLVQQRLFTALQHTNPNDITKNEREEYIQRLHAIWYSSLQQKTERQPIPLQDILNQPIDKSTVTIILGAPGSGKTTLLRWIALYHAQKSLATLQIEKEPLQVPLFIRTNDYAERIAHDFVSLRQFIVEQLNEENPFTAAKVMVALNQGHCLLLFDGLDQGFSVQTRRRVLTSVSAFIMDNSTEDADAHTANRFVITSRIADYESGDFAKYTHYTLLDLNDPEREQFLEKWCNALAKHLVMSMSSSQQETRVVAALSANSGLQQLATNPLALMMMIFVQTNGRDILQNRFELYQMITKTLLDTWNRESGRKMFSGEEISLAENVLSSLAYSITQTSTRILTVEEVELVVRQVISVFYRQQAQEVNENTVTLFIETLCKSSGLFANVGEGLYSFTYSAFQDYFAALYLLRKLSKERRQIAVQHYQEVIWREPLLLMLLSKSKRIDEQKEVNEILQAIMDTPGDTAAKAPFLVFLPAKVTLDASSTQQSLTSGLHEYKEA